jgi:hypothetical protein
MMLPLLLFDEHLCLILEEVKRLKWVVASCQGEVEVREVRRRNAKVLAAKKILTALRHCRGLSSHPDNQF